MFASSTRRSSTMRQTTRRWSSSRLRAIAILRASRHRPAVAHSRRLQDAKQALLACVTADHPILASFGAAAMLPQEHRLLEPAVVPIEINQWLTLARSRANHFAN